MQTTRVILADDHTAVRDGIRNILRRAPEIEVVGEAKNGIDALDLAQQLKPDVLLLDMEMPGLSGLEVTRRLKSSGCPVTVLAVSAYDDRTYILNMLSNGAAGYLTKEEMPEMVIDAIKSVARGERGWFSQRVIRQLIGSED